MMVLDSGAFLAIVKREEGASLMRRLLREHRGETFVHGAQLFEIYYGVRGASGTDRAERVWTIADKNGLFQRNDFDRDFLRDAAFVKATHKMSFADSFAIALARRLNCALVSTDHHELDAVHAAGVCNIIFIR